MTEVVQWATILSPIIAIIIAVVAIYFSSRDTNKKIAAIEENTAKQIKSIKELSRLTIEAALKQVDLECAKYLYITKQAQQEKDGLDEVLNSGFSHMSEWREGAIKNFQIKKPERDYELTLKFIKELEKFKQRLEDSMKNLSE